jgi:deoxyadenosine/deoxycytidine kinase
MENTKSFIRWVSIEGNVGSGKSTLVKYLKEMYEESKDKMTENNVIFVDEPVDEWEGIKDSTTKKTMLEMFYENQKENSFAFQMMAYISRLDKIKTAITSYKGGKPLVIISERSLETDRNVFAKMLYDVGMIRDVDYQIYNKWFQSFLKELPEPIYYYVKTDALICLERIHKRKRLGEDSIPLEYLDNCGKYHNEWINNILNKEERVIMINGNIKRENREDYMEYRSILEGNVVPL